MLKILRYKWRTRKYPYAKKVDLRAGYYEMIMSSKDEVLYQLNVHCYQKDLLKLLFYGKELKNYQELLLQTSMKYEFLGRLTYVMEGRGNEKPKYDEYTHYLVESFQESVCEVQGHLESLTGETVSYDKAKKVFGKFLFVMSSIIPCMALQGERIYTDQYRTIIEYAIEHDEPGMKGMDNMWSVFPLKKSRVRFPYERAFGHLPEELRKKLEKSNSEYGNILDF